MILGSFTVCSTTIWITCTEKSQFYLFWMSKPTVVDDAQNPSLIPAPAGSSSSRARSISSAQLSCGLSQLKAKAAATLVCWHAISSLLPPINLACSCSLAGCWCSISVSFGWCTGVWMVVSGQGWQWCSNDGWALWMVVVVKEEEGLLLVDAMGHRIYWGHVSVF